MKGQKGGKRDKLISNKFRDDNKKIEEEEFNKTIKKLDDVAKKKYQKE